jgi:hypothetical protein
MDLAADFSFQPLPPIETAAEQEFAAAAPAAPASPLGPLAPLVGKWAGRGFNIIWRPNHTPGQDRFLEINVTSEQIEFSPIPGEIPNRGLLQPDIVMFGLNYLDQITDANVNNAGLHFEPGLWVTVPRTTNPNVPPTVARLASIPHGTTVLLQGTAVTAAAGPHIPGTSIKPFTIGQPLPEFDFEEQTLTNPTSFRTSGAGLTGVTQAMVNNPNGVLLAAIAGQHIISTTTLHVTTTNTPVPGGGTANTAFLKGGPQGPNAVAASVDATFWLETLQGQSAPTQLQYAQKVLLNFNGLSWPPVTVATLHKA